MQSFSDFRELKSLSETRLTCTPLMGCCQPWLIGVRACPSTAVWLSCKHTIRLNARFLPSGRKAPCRYTVTLRTEASLRGQRIQESMGGEGQTPSSSGLSFLQVEFKVWCTV